MEGVTEVLLIRHAQMPPSTNPAEDGELTSIGLEQAEALGAFLAKQPLHAVYSSPTHRTRQTAEAVARHHGLPVLIMEDLREVEVYPPEDQDWWQFRESDVYKERQARFTVERRWDVYAPFMESSEKLRARATQAVTAVVERHPGQRVALFTHGPTIGAYVAGLLQSPYDMIGGNALTGITQVLALGDRRVLRTLNSTAHFGTI